MKAYFRKITFTSEHPTLHAADALRALASTIRLRLLGHLQLEGNATATECGLAVGESASACSYHLRQLAKHGFVEEVASGDGRERRWRARVVGFDFPAGAEEDDELRAASQLARAALLDLTDDAVRAYITHERSFSPAWREAAVFSHATIVATPAELDELADRIAVLLEPYARRNRPRAPRGARFVDIGVRAVPRQ